LLVVEVSWSSVGIDRTIKRPLYAAAGVEELWIVNLAGGVIEVCTEPGPGGYASVREVRAGEALAPRAFPDVAIDTRELPEGPVGS
jgi:Uma2 family endonuclease